MRGKLYPPFYRKQEVSSRTSKKKKIFQITISKIFSEENLIHLRFQMMFRLLSLFHYYRQKTIDIFF